MTFTIVAFDPRSGALGAASAASQPIASRCVLVAKARAGLVCSQGAEVGDVTRAALDALADSTDPRDAMRAALSRGDADRRQILIVDGRGRTVAHSGRNCRRLFAHTEGTDHAAAGDDLASPSVVGAMSLSFERSGSDPLPQRLWLALASGARAGGDRDAARSAQLVVYGDSDEPSIDLRVDDADDPTGELHGLLRRATGTM